jgi:uncharacterized protein (DUF488 family)
MTRAKLPPMFTVGHSTRTIEAFVDLLRAGHVERVVDIRSIPRSRTNPRYNLDALPDELASFQIAHTQIPELGGLRKKSKLVDPKTNAFWQNRSFHNYADYALSEEFEKGLAQLEDLSSGQRCAIMCSESVWWRCHRRIVADYLLSRGRQVCHLMGDNRVEPARMTPGARPRGTKLIYPVASPADR